MKSKILIFLLFSAYWSIIISCTDKLHDEHVIPYTPIDTRIELWMPDFQDLKIQNYPVYVRYSTPKGEPLGYRGNGIIVLKTGSQEYKCYDATCTNCPDADSHIEIKKGDPVAFCPTCHTEFFLPYGSPLDNENNESENLKIYPLREYPVIISNNTLIIRY